MSYREDKDIAIIGMSCRIAHADNPTEYWDVLVNRKSLIKTFTKKELLNSGFENKTIEHPNFIPTSAPLKDISSFDYNFFDYSFNDAKLIDPQIRLFLECSWEALEDSSYNPQTYDGSIGVFGGSFYSDYLLKNLIGTVHNDMLTDDYFYSVYQSVTDYLSSIISYKLNLKGPSVSVQTWCTTSLTAVHLACQNLISEDCDIALAGGVLVNVPQEGTFFKADGTISKSGICRTFDEKADGVVNGMGSGVVILKRLGDALSDRDNIHAIIKGSAILNEGKTDQKLSYHGLTVGGQYGAMKKAFAKADVSPESIDYIEVNGGSTPLLDRIEVQALEKFFMEFTSKQNYCSIGSNKPNIGSLGPAAGVASLIKIIMSLKNNKIPGQVNLDTLNRRLFSKDSPFIIARYNKEWSRNSAPRRACINAYGVGGNYAHFIIEEAPEISVNKNSGPYLINLSAKSRVALCLQIENLINFIKGDSLLNLNDVSYSLNIGRVSFDYRHSLVCNSREDALKQLEKSRKFLDNCRPTKIDRKQPLVFLFSGFGDQQVNMGKELYCKIDVFRDAIEECATLFMKELHIDIKKVLYPDTNYTDQANILIHQIEYGSSVLFSYQYALAKTLIKLGIVPDKILGYSLGESVAASISGVLTLEEMVFYLSKVVVSIKSGRKGSMIIASIEADKLQGFLNDEVQIAGIYSSTQYLISGSRRGIDKLTKSLESEDIKVTPFISSYPLHSSFLKNASKALLKEIGNLDFKKIEIPYISGTTGTWMTNYQAQSAHYWAKSLVQPIQFEKGFKEVAKENGQIFIKFTQSRIPSRIILNRNLRFNESKTLNFVPINSRKEKNNTDGEYLQFLKVIGRLWANGIKIKWEVLYNAKSYNRVSLPTYPFERKDCWQNPENGLHGRPENMVVSDRPSEDLNASSNLAHEIKEMWRSLLGNQNITLNDHFIALGGNSLSCMMFLNKFNGKHKNYKLNISDVFNLGTIAKIANFLEQEQDQKDSEIIEHILFSKNTAKRYQYIIKYIENGLVIAQLVASIQEESVNLVIRDFMYKTKKDLDIVLFDHEVLKCKSIEEVAELVNKILIKKREVSQDNTKGFSDLKSFSWIPKNIDYCDKAKLDSDIIFVLTSQRSGSTLLRLMLGGNPLLVSPPELGLLIYDNMADWQKYYCSSKLNMDGVISLIKELDKLEVEDARILVEEWVQNKKSTKEVYQFLQSKLNGRILIDKSPDYSYDIRSLYKAEKMFNNPRYIFIHRHPYSVIDSFARARFDKLSGFDIETPHLLAEDVWLKSNNNIIEFSKSVDNSRFFKICYEDMVQNPLRTIKTLCSGLKIEFNPNMLEPYQGRTMLVGPGDPNIFNHDGIDASLAYAWKEVNLSISLCQESQKLALSLGYELP